MTEAHLSLTSENMQLRSSNASGFGFLSGEGQRGIFSLKSAFFKDCNLVVGDKINVVGVTSISVKAELERMSRQCQHTLIANCKSRLV